MAHYAQPYTLKPGYGPASITMPKRARVLGVGCAQNGAPVLFATSESNADTRAFDTGQHQRHFEVIGPGDEIPADGQYVGVAQHNRPTKGPAFLLVFEVPGIRGPR
jgi:hypothetical protein